MKDHELRDHYAGLIAQVLYVRGLPDKRKIAVESFDMADDLVAERRRRDGAPRFVGDEPSDADLAAELTADELARKGRA